LNKLAVVAGVVILLLVGGGLTSQLIIGGGRSLFITQSAIPDASTLAAAPWQAEQLVLLIGFVLFNLVGMAATIALVMWFLHRGVKQSRATETGIKTRAGGE
jgi:hypothetical protein